MFQNFKEVVDEFDIKFYKINDIISKDSKQQVVRKNNSIVIKYQNLFCIKNCKLDDNERVKDKD